MNYFISKRDCSILSDNTVEIYAGAKFLISEIENKFSTIIDKESGKVVFVNFYDLFFKKKCSKYFKMIKTKQDNFCFFDFVDDLYNFCIEVFGEILNFEASNHIKVAYGEDTLILKKNENIKFSHIEYFEKIAVLFFQGERDFIVIVEKNKIRYCEYYDEIKLENNNLTVLTKLTDSLNHGKVAKIENGKFESYLVYLDNNDLNMKPEFLTSVFLDCLLAGNEKYLQNLLEDSLKSQIENLQEFCLDILDFYPINKTQCLVEKKDAKFDIFEFNIIDNKISNITIVDC